MINIVKAEAFSDDASFEVLAGYTGATLRHVFEFVKEEAVGAAQECGGIVDIGEGTNGLPHADILLNNKVVKQIICEEV